MTKFPIYWKLGSVVNSDERNRTILRRNLNDEWAIVCVVQKDIVGVWKHTSIELHRKNSVGEISISGELRLFAKNPWLDLTHKRFRCSIKTGSSFTEMLSNMDIKFYHQNCRLFGHVNIRDINAKQPSRLANEESKEKIQLKSLDELSKDLERILNPDSSYFSDVALKCGGASIPAHKLILSARSPIFARMFANPMKESLENVVDITDIDESVLRELLKYMYTGKVSDLTESSAADLLFAADKYQLQDLQTVCLYFLKDCLSVKNVWNVLVLGHLHSADLKSLAVDFICNKCGEFSAIQNSQEWKSLRKERPDLAMELLESLLLYRDEKLKQ